MVFFVLFLGKYLLFFELGGDCVDDEVFIFLYNNRMVNFFCSVVCVFLLGFYVLSSVW